MTRGPYRQPPTNQPEKTVTISSQSERRERDPQELFRRAKKPVALFIDDAHDLHPKTLTALKRLTELVAEGGQLSIVLIGHPKLKNDLRRPKMEEVIAGYIEIFRNTPLVLQLFWIHFAIPKATGISTTPFQSGVIAIALQSSAYLADVARAGIQAVPAGQWEAADALGLSTRNKWLDVVLPQALKIVIPPLANIAVGYFKASAALALLSVGELMTVTSRIAQYSFKPIEAYTLAGLIYLVLGAILSNLTFRLERAYRTPGARP